ncbi:hypothetical protein JCM8547_002364 [Rhodosporidiobolus lusitaniae]
MSDDEYSERISFLQPTGYSSSTCGYCSEKGKRSPTKSSKSYGCWAHVLSCPTYKDLLDRGWRRSGEYLYKPDMDRTCCPQYTISLNPSQFRPSRSQRQILLRFNAFIQHGEREGQPGWGPARVEKTKEGEEGDVEMKQAGEKGGKGGKKDKGKGKAGQQKQEDWGEMITAADWEKSPEDKPFKHRFEYILEPASFNDEKYQLYRRYQMQVHGDSDSKVTERGFRGFLCNSPLNIEPTRSPSHSHGSFHALYRLDNKLIAFAVLDLLPHAVSSVYFVWDPDYAGMSLGKVSALREAQIVRTMEKDGAWGKKGDEGKGRYMMGFYIHSCAKMRYKAEYQPSFLLDPETNVYYLWSTCKPLLDVASPKVASFSRPAPSSCSSTPSLPPPPTSATAPSQPSIASSTTESLASTDEDTANNSSPSSHSQSDDSFDDDSDFPSPPPLGCYDPSELPKDLLLGTFVLEKRTLVPLVLSTVWHDPEQQKEARELLAVTGDAAKGKLAIFPGR